MSTVKIPVPNSDDACFEVEYVKGDVPYVGRDGRLKPKDDVLAEIRAMSESIDTLWERYPVQPGECWSVGGSLFLCGDIVEVAIAQQLTDMLGTERFIAYSNPRRMAGACTAFRDAARLFACDFEDYVSAWANLVMDADAIYLEATTSLTADENPYYGTLAVRGQVVRHAQRLVCPDLDNALLLVHFSPAAAEQTVPTGPSLRGVMRLQALDIILSTYAPTLIFDPCMNISFGALARAAINNGHRFIGCEVRPRVMAVTLAGQERITGIAPERIA